MCTAKHVIQGLVSLLLLCGTQAKAQLTYIDDVDLRALYNFHVPGCVDASGYLDTQHPGVLALDTVLFQVLWQDPHVTGLEAFTGLSKLELVGGVGTATVDAFPPNLTDLGVGRGFQTIPAIPPTVLTLGVWGDFTVLPALPPNLLNFFVDDCEQLQELPPLPGSLRRLEMLYDPVMNTLPALPPSLRYLHLRDVGCTVLPPFPQVHMEYIALELMDQLTVLPALPDTVDQVSLAMDSVLTTITAFPRWCDRLSVESCDALPVLPPFPDRCQWLDVSFNSTLTWLPQLPATGLLNTSFRELPYCTCLPILPDEVGLLNVFGSGFTCLPNVTPDPDFELWGPFDASVICDPLNTLCPSVSATISGHVFHDVNANAVRDAGEPGLGGSVVSFAPLGIMSGTDATGYYHQYLYSGAWSVSASEVVPYVVSIAPATRDVTLADLEESTDQDFAVVLQTNVHDLEVHIAAGDPHPGFSNPLWITYHNNGTVVMDGTVSLTHDPQQSVQASNPAPTTVNGNTLIWDFAQLGIGETRSVALTMYSPPTIAPGTAVLQTAQVLPQATDATPANNQAVVHSVQTAALDPNYKAADPAWLDPSEAASTRLTYTIHFQNTGTYMATQVIVTDTLSSSLDPTTFQFLGSSHTCTWFVHNGVLRFTFDGINLLDSSSNEPESHGYLQFSIMPSATVQWPVANIANIYFDFNAPVITEPCLVDLLSGVNDRDAAAMHLYPNPVSDRLWLSFEYAVGNVPIEVCDATGRPVLRATVGAGEPLNVEALAPGAYVVRTLTGAQRAQQRFVKR